MMEKVLFKQFLKKNWHSNGKLCTWFDKLECSFFFFLFIEKLYPPVSSTLPASWKAKAIGRGIEVRAKVEQKGRLNFLYLSNSFSLSPLLCTEALSQLSLSLSPPSFEGNRVIKNCQLALERGRKSISVTQSLATV